MQIIETSQGHSVIVDDIDADAVRAHKWYPHIKPGGRVYAKARIDGKWKYLHRFILERMPDGIPPGYVCDHIDNDLPHDNTRQNLRAVLTSENLQNRGKTRANTSGYKGVSQQNGQYSVTCKRAVDTRAQADALVDNMREMVEQLMVTNGKRPRAAARYCHITPRESGRYTVAIRLYRFQDANLAARAYDALAQVMHEGHARLNFSVDADPELGLCAATMPELLRARQQDVPSAPSFLVLDGPIQLPALQTA